MTILIYHGDINRRRKNAKENGYFKDCIVPPRKRKWSEYKEFEKGPLKNGRKVHSRQGKEGKGQVEGRVDLKEVILLI